MTDAETVGRKSGADAVGPETGAESVGRKTGAETVGRKTGLAAHLIPLDPDAPPAPPDWAAWRTVALRGAGFPADLVVTLTDPELAAAADALMASEGTAASGPPASGPAGDPAAGEAYLATYEAATRRLSATVRELAATPRFREAVTWQNPKLLPFCLDKLAAGEPRTAHGREHEQTAVSYVQRYAVKNDTIGFTGPVGWATLTDDGAPLEIDVAPNLLARHTVYFEVWALNEVARTLSRDPRIRPHVAPRLIASHRLDGQTLHLPDRKPVSLTPAEAALMSLVDGERSALDIADELAHSGPPEFRSPGRAAELLEHLEARELLEHTLEGVIETFPERSLQERLDRIADPQVRTYASAILGRLLAARDRVSASAGDDVALAAAMAALTECFSQITGLAGERRPGETYGGRTIIYLDTVRGTRVRLGPELRTQLGRPLRLVLDSARWLLSQTALVYERELTDIYHRRVAAQSGHPDVPLATLVRRATPLLMDRRKELAPQFIELIDEFQRRWAAVLDLGPDGPDAPGALDRPGALARQVIRRGSDEIAERVAKLFPPSEPGWLTAHYHSPDFMLAATDADAVARGEYEIVLGELHMGKNTLESRCFVEQHDDPRTFTAHELADLGAGRVYFLPPMRIEELTSRAAPPTAVLVPEFTYWTLHRESIRSPNPPIPAVDLVVYADHGRLMVRSLRGPFTASLLEVLSEALSGGVTNAFRPIGRGPHTPRVCIDRLVVARESWNLPAAEATWAFRKPEANRFAAARAWRAAHGLPERAFYGVPVEEKPSFVDFTSLPLVNLLAKAIRRSAEVQGSLTLTEMLPDLSQLWLPDHDGARYTSEFRMCVVDLLDRVHNTSKDGPRHDHR
jgi:hypothetical protein